VVPAAYGGRGARIDVRSLCVIREALAYASGLCDHMFATQALGSGPIVLFGDESQKKSRLPRVAEGTSIAAFALTEPQAGSDPLMIATVARRENNGYVLNQTLHLQRGLGRLLRGICADGRTGGQAVAVDLRGRC
jgi:acyl-CoA dehydrogenase